MEEWLIWLVGGELGGVLLEGGVVVVVEEEVPWKASRSSSSSASAPSLRVRVRVAEVDSDCAACAIDSASTPWFVVCANPWVSCPRL